MFKIFVPQRRTHPRYPGGAKEGGVQYPQAVPVTAPGQEGFWAIFSLNKEDIWVVCVPFAF
jgi:hypothetical protein